MGLGSVPFPLHGEPPYQTKERVKAIEPTLSVISTPEGLEKYRLEFRKVGDQVLLYQGGKPFDTHGAPAIFVMDREGHFYATTEQVPNVFNHLSFLAGRAVAAAGEMLARRGELREMNNRSGHYVPGQEFHYQALHALATHGVVPFRGVNTVPEGWTPGTCSYSTLSP